MSSEKVLAMLPLLKTRGLPYPKEYQERSNFSYKKHQNNTETFDMTHPTKG